MDAHLQAEIASGLDVVKDALGETDGSIYINDTISVLSFALNEPCVLELAAIAPEKRTAPVEELVQAMMFICTGEEAVPVGHGNSFLAQYAVTPEIIRDHISELVSKGVIPEQAALVAFNETVGMMNGSMGPHLGVMMRLWPVLDKGLHPLIVSSIDYEDIPVPVRENSEQIWQELKAQNTPDIGDDPASYTKFVYASAIDQLNKIYTGIKMKMPLVYLTLSNPATKAVGDRSILEQPIFERTVILSQVTGLVVQPDYSENKLDLRVSLTACQLFEIYDILLPMFSFFLSKVATDLGMTPGILDFVVDRFITPVTEENIKFYTDLLENSIPTKHAIPEFVPDIQLRNITLSNIFPEKQNGQDHQQESAQAA